MTDDDPAAASKNWLATLQSSSEQLLRESARIRLPPWAIVLTADQTATKIAGLLIVSVIFWIARATLAGYSTSWSGGVLLTAVFIAITFVIGWLATIASPADAVKVRERWSVFAVVYWLESLIVLIVLEWPTSLIAYTTTTERVFVDYLGFPGGPGFDVFRAILISLIAWSLLIVRTKRSDPTFAIRDGILKGYVLFAITFNTMLLYVCVYGIRDA